MLKGTQQRRLSVTAQLAQHTYRLKETRDHQDTFAQQKKYRGTFYLLNDHLAEDDPVNEKQSQVAAECQLFGHACFAITDITDSEGSRWQLRPNRKIMPSRWILYNANGAVCAQYDQKIMGKLVMPFYRVLLTVLDANEVEIARVVDVTSTKADMIFDGTGPHEWAVLHNDKQVAKLARLEAKAPLKPGWRGKRQSVFRGRDDGIQSYTPNGYFKPAEGLALLLIAKALKSLNNH